MLPSTDFHHKHIPQTPSLYKPVLRMIVFQVEIAEGGPTCEDDGRKCGWLGRTLVSRLFHLDKSQSFWRETSLKSHQNIRVPGKKSGL